MNLLAVILILLFTQPAFAENSNIPAEASVAERTSLKGGAAYSGSDFGEPLKFWYPVPNGLAGHWKSREMTTGLLGQSGTTKIVEDDLDIGNAIDSRGVRWNASTIGVDMWDRQHKVCTRLSSVKKFDSGPNIMHVVGKYTEWHLENNVVHMITHRIDEQIYQLLSPDTLSYKSISDIRMEYPKEMNFKGFKRQIYQLTAPVEISYQNSLNEYLKQIHRQDLIPNHMNP